MCVYQFRHPGKSAAVRRIIPEGPIFATGDFRKPDAQSRIGTGKATATCNTTF